MKVDKKAYLAGSDSQKLPGWPVYADDEITSTEKVLASGRTNYWTGNEGRSFEQEFAEYFGVNRAITVSNGSVALGIALRALQLPPNSEVIVTPRTFIATASEILLAGHRPIFADIDLDSQNITAETIEPLISERTGAVMLVHLAGWPCDMPAITSLAGQHGIKVIEDCAQAPGGTVNDRKVGSWGDLAAFSFCQDKIISTGGEGGMIVTDDETYWRRCWSHKDHGKNPDLMSSQSSGNAFRWVHEAIGTNGRMTEIQAAIGRCQLAKLDTWLGQRRANAGRLNTCLEGLSALRTTLPGEGVQHAYYKYYCFIRPEALKSSWSRDRILGELADLEIPVGSGICPEVYLESAFSESGDRPPRRLANARELGETSIMLPVHPTMNEGHMDRMADALINVIKSAKR